MSESASCGLVAVSADSIDRLGLIAIRYRSWMGEALAQAILLGSVGGKTLAPLRALCGSFDMIEHLAEDFLIENGPRAGEAERFLADAVCDQAERMKLFLSEFGTDMKSTGLHLPSMGDLEQLCSVCRARGAVGSSSPAA